MSRLENFAEKDAQKSWQLLEESIGRIYEKKASGLSYDELYRNVYHLILHRFGDMTYQYIQDYMRTHLKHYHQRLMQAQEAEFLIEFSTIWRDIREMQKRIAKIYLYMDRNFVTVKELIPLEIAGNRIFVEVFLEDEGSFRKFQQQMLATIRRERDGEHIDRSLVKNLLSMLIELGTQATYSTPANKSAGIGTIGGNPQTNKNVCTLIATRDVYKKYFEKDFLIETGVYYQEEAQRNISNLTPTDYLLKAERRFQEELERVEVYLDMTTKRPLVDVFMDMYINSHSKTISESDGLPRLFDSERMDEILKVYNMCAYTERSVSIYHDIYLDYQKKNLAKILTSSAEEQDDYLVIVRNLIEFHKKIERISVCIQNKQYEREQAINKIVKDAFSQHINMSQKVAFAINFYFDYHFKEGFKSLKDTEVEVIINDALVIFRYIHDRDVFEKIYKTFLGKRLLTGNSLSEENEKLLVQRLQQECGCYYTAKIEVMFKDIAISKMTMIEFHEMYNPESAKLLASKETLESIKAFDAQILTTGNWTFPEHATCNLPIQLKAWIKLFEDFYTNKHPGRGMKWMFSQGSAELRGVFAGKKKELLVTTYQMCILLLFNNNQSLSVKNIVTQTMIPKEEVDNHLAAFLNLKLVTKDPKSAEIKEDDMITINDEFTHKSYRIRVPLKKKKEKSQEGEKKVLDAVKVERKYWVEACVVRIMKSRKRFEHLQLIEEVMKLTTLHQFRPNITLIKNVIEELIEREYIGRDPQSKSTYIYIS